MCFDIVPLNNSDNAILLHLGSLKEWFVLHDLSCVLNCRQDIYIHFLTYNTLRIIVGLFFSIFSSHLTLVGHLFFFQLHLLMKGLIFNILCEPFPISSSFNATVAAYWKHLSSPLIGFVVAFLFFIQLGESIYNPLQFWLILWHL